MDRIQLKQQRKKKRLLKRLVLTSIMIMGAIALYFGYTVFSVYNAASNSYSELERGMKSELRTEEVKITKEPFSMLIMGIEDYSSEGVGRTDSLMVATIDPVNKSVKLLSIPRDTLVDIPGEGEDKINHAYAKGKKDLTIATVEEFLDIPIDYYTTIGFKGFKEIINEIGGITVDVPFDFYENSDVDNSKIYFTEGEMNLNGEEALAYARMRKQDPRGDFGRNERQQEVIQAAIDKLLSPTNLLKIDSIAQHIGDNVETNFKVSDALAVQSKFKDFNTSSIEKLSITGTDVRYSGIYYFQADPVELTEVKSALKAHLNHISSTVKNSEIDEVNEEL
ncbi:LytR family transcriptional regulator [Bacillus coahuilensis p1.1.43]|uniref:LytR family transcriptional regulator n=1 Tax=Bacillus coahuilensis p1.1.43 TaxID=1150625 RepID=A0A147K4K2_9BACI|nr:LCP family protein [Bacillus coahuilensis]KUP04378.1 LytR family transcriptional regulator [Bacillus coahuilensis p1.1.43]